MTWEELREKATTLPLEPGVYLMADKHGVIIYVGKAKKLRNRVSQYFQDSASHSPKTRIMVQQIFSFDTIVARSEFEALVLECSLIKRHMPKYNILLKDDKGYPYLRIDMGEKYPNMSMVGRVEDDGAEYFGPYGGRFITQNVIDTIRLTLKLPGCHKQFPRDMGKQRPCLNFHMSNCDGWCQHTRTQSQYYENMQQAVKLLHGKYQQVEKEMEVQMLQFSENLQFEQAAALRDRLRAISALSQKQLVTAGTLALCDVVGYYQNEAKGCFTILHYVDGSLLDKDYQIVPPSDSPEEIVSSLVKQYYLAKQGSVKEILLPMEMEDSELFEQLMQEHHKKKVHLRLPQRGDYARLVELANKNAREEAERASSKEEKLAGSIQLLTNMLNVPSLKRIEAYDISNFGGDDIVASMTVFENGAPYKKDYKRFKIEGLTAPDDYASMRQVIRRRFAHYVSGDGSFATRPDALFIDGGHTHAAAVEEELADMGIVIATFGMVKDNRHRTRALIRSNGDEIGIRTIPPVFAMVGRIQEETHRFAISYQKLLRSKRLYGSELDKIDGIGPKRKTALLKHFKSITKIKTATAEELREVLPKSAAEVVYQYFHHGV